MASVHQEAKSVGERRAIRGPGGNLRAADGSRRGGTALGIGCERFGPCEAKPPESFAAGEPTAEVRVRTRNRIRERLHAHCSGPRTNQLHGCSLLSRRRAWPAPSRGRQTNSADIERRASNHPAEKEMRIARIAHVSAVVIVVLARVRGKSCEPFLPPFAGARGRPELM